MKLENGYKLVYTASNKDGVRTIKASKELVPTDADVELDVKDAEEKAKLVYEGTDGVYYSEKLVPTEDDTKISSLDEIFVPANESEAE